MRSFLAAAAALVLAACNSTFPVHAPGSAALVGCAGELDWIQLDSGQRSRTYETTPHPDQVLVAPIGGQVAILDRAAETITVFDTVERVQRRVIRLPEAGVPLDIEFTDARSRLAVACAGGTELLVVGTKTGDVLSRTDCGGTPVAVAAKLDDDVLAVALRAPNSIALFPTDGGDATKRLALPATPTDVAWHPERKELWITSADADTVMIVDVDASRVRVEACAGGPTTVLVNYDARHALVLCEKAGVIARFDVEARSQVWRARPPACADGSPAQPSTIALQPPGRYLMVAIPNDDRLDELNIETGNWPRSLPTAKRPTAVGWLRIKSDPRVSVGVSL